MLGLEVIEQPRVVRTLTAEDLQAKPEGRVQVSTVKKVGDRHHHLARCLASGMSGMEAAVTAGYCLSRVSILKADPLFQELVEFYRKTKADVFADTEVQLKGLMTDALSELKNRLEESPEKIPTKDLLKAVELSADRSGFGPTSTHQNIDVNLSAELKAAKARREARIIDGNAVEVVDA